jgi:hypothetical protein
MMMISSLLIVAVVVLAVGRVEKSTILFHAFHRPVFHFPEFTIPKPELTLQSDLLKNFSEDFAADQQFPASFGVRNFTAMPVAYTEKPRGICRAITANVKL